MILKTILIDKPGRDAILIALSQLADLDSDFNGDNGEDCLWEVSKSNGYECNSDYLLDEVTKNDDDELLVKEFIDRWIDKDSYYTNYCLDIVKDEDEMIKAISLVLVTE